MPAHSLSDAIWPGKAITPELWISFECSTAALSIFRRGLMPRTTNAGGSTEQDAMPTRPTLSAVLLPNTRLPLSAYRRRKALPTATMPGRCMPTRSDTTGLFRRPDSRTMKPDNATTAWGSLLSNATASRKPTTRFPRQAGIRQQDRTLFSILEKWLSTGAIIRKPQVSSVRPEAPRLRQISPACIWLR